MKKLLLLLSLCLFGLTSCDLTPAIEGNGVLTSEERSLDYFDKIILDIPADLHLSQGYATDLRLSAEENVLDFIETKVVAETLYIKYVEGWARTNYKVKLTLQIPDIRAINNTGGGRVIGENRFHVNHIDLDAFGGGLIDLALEASGILDVNIFGSGTVYLEGSATVANYTVSGNGYLNGFKMYVSSAYVDMSGTGLAETSVFDKLDVNIFGSGDVVFRGNPFVFSSITGEGRLINAL